MPAPSSRLSGCSLRELCYDTAFAMKNRILFPALRDKLLDNSLVQSVLAEARRPHCVSAQTSTISSWTAKLSDCYATVLAVQAIQNSKRQSSMRSKTEMLKRRWANERRSRCTKLIWLRRNLSPEDRGRLLNVLGDFSSVRRTPDSGKSRQKITMKCSSN